jgi:GntR family transcriptional repressor for pyruvate dehydrogenase complex
VLAALREHIVSHQLRPGDRLPGEQQLAAELGVSRNVVREGLKALQMAGVVVRRPRAGTTLRSLDLSTAAEAITLPIAPSRSEMEELFLARHYLELALLPLIAANVQESHFRRMEAAIVQQTRDLEAGGDGVAGDTAFHRALLEAVGNRHLAQLGELVRRYFTSARQLMKAEPMMREARLASIGEHRLVVAALRRGDAATAREVMDTHLSRARPRPAEDVETNGG